MCNRVPVLRGTQLLLSVHALKLFVGLPQLG